MHQLLCVCVCKPKNVRGLQLLLSDDSCGGWSKGGGAVPRTKGRRHSTLAFLIKECIYLWEFGFRFECDVIEMEITELPFPVTVKGSAIQGWSVLRRVLRYCGPLVRGYDKNGWWKGTLLWFCGEGVGRDCHCF
ncbi:hypothetical protein CEXT_278241 [Caerostris extrusa]|uniref:Uncharacterized protein n=1 Tax=Caerostris extrusa TaxID=172846 RepID=A0AAV4W2T7_CAEEX|nr:hypothetical protein CEXT_278241 [Caerostris extrusa]